MNKIIIYFLIFGFFAFTKYTEAQVIVRKAVGFRVTKPLREIKGIPPRHKTGLKEIPNKFYFNKKTDNKIPGSVLKRDPVVQSTFGTNNTTDATLDQNWAGINNINGVYPPDTQGDVGPNHYVQAVNLSFQIWDKQGNSLYGPYDLSTIWDGFNGDWSGTNDGDPIVLYDQEADRWLISQFSLPHQRGIFIDPPYYELVAISKTPDPTGEWYQYAFEFDDYMPDYPHLGVWPDGYYMATNGFDKGLFFASAGATVFERDKMLQGDSTARMVYFAVANLTNGGEAGNMLPSDWDGVNTPPAGSPNYFTYFQDDSDNGVPADRLRMWEFHVDWNNTNNSTFTLTTTLNTDPFDSEITGGRDAIPQPDTDVNLDAVSDRLMFRLQYRNFGDHEAMVTNHTVDVGVDHAGVRWYELRKSGNGSWAIYQQGTYAPDADHRWVASVAMNGNGDIGMEFTVSSDNTYPSIRWTGRLASDPLGQMTIPEIHIVDGSGSQTGTGHRWGDYSMLSVDPVDDATFWATNEYIKTTGGAPWETRIASISMGNSTVLADIKVFLEGPYNGTNMDINLKNNNLIPLTSPYSEDPRSVTAIPDNIVDWVLVELRESANGPAVTSKSAFLRNDGKIVGDDGNSKITLNKSAGNYYIVVKHRNHLAAMSANAVALPNASVYDFSSSGSQAFGTNGTKDLGSGVFGLYGGDSNSDEFIDADDFMGIDNNMFQNNYSDSDTNCDGFIDSADFTVVDNNKFKGSQVP